MMCLQKSESCDVRADQVEVKRSFQQRGAERVKGLESVLCLIVKEYIHGGAVPVAAMKTSVKPLNLNFNKTEERTGVTTFQTKSAENEGNLDFVLVFSGRVPALKNSSTEDT